MTTEREGGVGASGIWALVIVILAVPAYFLIHAWLSQGPDRPDPHPLPVQGDAHTVAPQAPQRQGLVAEAAPYS